MLVDEDAQRAALLEATLLTAGYDVIAVFCGQGQLRDALRIAKPDLIIIDFDSPNRDTLEHLASLNQERDYPVILCAAEMNTEMLRNAIEAGVSAYVARGLSGCEIASALELAMARFREYRHLKRELEEAKSKLAERKLVERAKSLLMRRQGIDEEKAYTALRGLAMRRQLRLGAAARLLLDASEVLA